MCLTKKNPKKQQQQQKTKHDTILGQQQKRIESRSDSAGCNHILKLIPLVSKGHICSIHTCGLAAYK